MTTQVQPADENKVLREQLEYLIGHTTEHVECECPECQRYLRARAVLLEIFREPRAPQVAAAPPTRCAARG